MAEKENPDGRPDERARAVRAALCRLAALASETAEAASALALLMARIANAEDGVSGEETACIENVLASLDRVEEEQAVLLTEIGKHRIRDLDAAGTYRVSRVLRSSSSREELAVVLARLVAVAAADGVITATEAGAIRQVAAELGFDRAAVAAALDGSN